MAKPKPSTPPGENSEGRTYEEQTNYENLQKRNKDTNPLADWLSKRVKEASKPVKLKTGKPVKTSGSAPANMVMKKTALKKKAASKKKFDIPASPTK